MKLQIAANACYSSFYYGKSCSQKDETNTIGTSPVNQKEAGAIDKVKAMVTQINQPSSAVGFSPNQILLTKELSNKQGEYLPFQGEKKRGKKTLVLDLDETLVHSAFQAPQKPDLTIPLNAEGKTFFVYVLKRPGVDKFLHRLSELYELVIFTASMPAYANPLLDKLDPHKFISHRLFRQHCCIKSGGYVKDLSLINRSLSNTLIIDNSPNAYSLQRANALPIETWLNDPRDRQLFDLLPVLELLATAPGDVRTYVKKLIKSETPMYSR
eukprot:TRINITY_DN23919_c0_g1_i2.p1 TRINITY_DN23919_c0_g1~~TRINITY_DN23919_c0_g1_i2.p1  ORF type:complete len:269 (-),score=26.09 TRINITY_DN23919_c0_g1_i2:5-811(-)